MRTALVPGAKIDSRVDEKEFGGFAAVACDERFLSVTHTLSIGALNSYFVTQTRICFNCRRMLLCSVSYCCRRDIWV